MSSYYTPPRVKTLSCYHIVTIKKSITAFSNLKFCIVSISIRRSWITNTNCQCRQPSFFEISLSQEKYFSGKVPILVYPVNRDIWLRIVVCCSLHQHTYICNLNTFPKRHIKRIRKSVVIRPFNRRKCMIIDKIARNHECPLPVHHRRRHLQQPGRTVQKLRLGRKGR